MKECRTLLLRNLALYGLHFLLNVGTPRVLITSPRRVPTFRSGRPRAARQAGEPRGFMPRAPFRSDGKLRHAGHDRDEHRPRRTERHLRPDEQLSVSDPGLFLHHRLAVRVSGAQSAWAYRPAGYAKCDMTIKQCVADVYVGVLVIIDFSMDTAFTTGIAQSSADAVREMTINYSLTNNTNLQIDKLDIFVGPDRLVNAADPRAIYLDWIGPIGRGETFTQDQKPLVISR